LVSKATQNEVSGQAELPLDSATTEAQSDSAPPSEVRRTVSDEVPSPTTAPVDECDLSTAADSRPLSADEQRAFDAVFRVYKAAPKIVQERFKSIVLQRDTSAA
jgi:hypothetical protein